MNDTTITLNPAKSSELEFDVSVEGANDGANTVVRFVMSLDPNYDCVFKCEHVGGSKWKVKFPELTFCKLSSVPFKVEVVVGEYFFEPSQGTALMVTDTSSKPAASPKPSVTATIGDKAKDPEDKDEKKAEEDEQMGRLPSPQYGGELSPTNQFMEPEFEPTQSDVKIGNAPVYDQMIDKTKIEDISSSVTPGETTDPEPQHGNNPTDEGDEEEFDPRKVAESIVFQMIGSTIVQPQTPGRLFQRDQDGKPVIAGLESPAVKAEKAAKSLRVKEILRTGK